MLSHIWRQWRCGYRVGIRLWIKDIMHFITYKRPVRLTNFHSNAYFHEGHHLLIHYLNLHNFMKLHWQVNGRCCQIEQLDLSTRALCHLMLLSFYDKTDIAFPKG